MESVLLVMVGFGMSGNGPLTIFLVECVVDALDMLSCSFELFLEVSEVM